METKLKEYLTDNQDKFDEVVRFVIELAMPLEDDLSDLDIEEQERLAKIIGEFIFERCEVLFPDLF